MTGMIVVVVVCSLAISALLVLLLGERIERLDREERAAAAEARRVASFERHVAEAFEVADPVDWRRHEAEWRS